MRDDSCDQDLLTGCTDSEFLSMIVFDAFTELLVTICIVVNVIFLALDHYSLEYDGM